MKFYFCEKCGKRITDAELEQGLGRDKKLKGVYCTACSVGVMTVETLAINDQQLQAARAEAARAETAHPVQQSADKLPAARAKAASANPTNFNLPIYGGALALGVLGLGIFVAMGRGKTDNAVVKGDESKQPEKLPPPP